MTRKRLLFPIPILSVCLFLSGCKSDACSAALRGQAQKLLAAGRAVVVKPVADMCSKPPCRGGLSDQALFGDVVKVLPMALLDCVQADNAFVQIETQSTYRGFLQLDSLRPLSPDEPAYRDGGKLLRVTSRLASVYAQTEVTTGKPIVQLPVDSRLRLISPVDERWLKVLLPAGNEGYIQRGDIAELEVTPPSARCLIEHARLYAGTPYLWGGRSTLGIDCSGLVSNAFIACGVVPPRDASPQFGWSQLQALPLEADKLVAGDLLFFGTLREGAPPKVTHVGIFVGDGRFIHATTHEHPVVQESSLADPHWTASWVGARRYPFPS